MCINQPVSWITFAIGITLTIAGAIYFRSPMNIATIFMILSVLLMQVSDAITWNLKSAGKKETKTSTRMGYLVNLTQPIVTYMALVLVTPANLICKILATLVCFAYVSVLIMKAPAGTSIDSTPVKNKHLNYDYWNKIGGYWYVLAFAPILLLLIRPFPTALVITGYIYAVLMISFFSYDKGNIASMWCFFASFIPVVVYGIQFIPSFRMH
jgi:hypothetical protein